MPKRKQAAIEGWNKRRAAAGKDSDAPIEFKVPPAGQKWVIVDDKYLLRGGTRCATGFESNARTRRWVYYCVGLVPDNSSIGHQIDYPTDADAPRYKSIFVEKGSLPEDDRDIPIWNIDGKPNAPPDPIRIADKALRGAPAEEKEEEPPAPEVLPPPMVQYEIPPLPKTKPIEFKRTMAVDSDVVLGGGYVAAGSERLKANELPLYYVAWEYTAEHKRANYAFIERKRAHSRIPANNADLDDYAHLIYVNDETVAIDFNLWLDLKERFISQVRRFGFDKAWLTSVKNDVFGTFYWRKASVFPPIGFYLVPNSSTNLTAEQHAENKALLEAGHPPRYANSIDEHMASIYGCISNPDNTNRLMEIVETAMDPYRIHECKTSGWVCLKNACWLFIRTPWDWLRIVRPMHNIIAATSVNSGTIAGRFGDIVKISGGKFKYDRSKVGFEPWQKEPIDVIAEWTERKSVYPLHNKHMYGLNRDAGKHHLNERMANTVQIPEMNFKQILADGYVKYLANAKQLENGHWVLDPKPAGKWPEWLVWLCLITGARRIELLSIGKFSVPTETDFSAAGTLKLEWWATPELRAQYFKQEGVAKKRGSASASVTSGKDNMILMKPLLGGKYTEDGVNIAVPLVVDFIKRWFRPAMYEYVNSKVSGLHAGEPDWTKISRQELSNITQSKTNKVFQRVWKQVIDFNAHNRPHFVLHSMRAVYGLETYWAFAKSKVNFLIWISRMLGHNIDDTSVAQWYTTVNIVRTHEDLQGRSWNAVMNDYATQAQGIVLNLQLLLDKIKLERAKVQIEMLSNEAGELVAVEKLANFRDREERKLRSLDILSHMDVNHVPMSNSNLRKLGFSGAVTDRILKSLPNFREAFGA
jgi:Telomere resolvase